MINETIVIHNGAISFIYIPFILYHLFFFQNKKINYSSAENWAKLILQATHTHRYENYSTVLVI